MISIICPDCGFVNLEAEECKRCHVKFHQPELIPNTSSSRSEDPLEPTGEFKQKARAPLPDYFYAEPAPFSAPVIIFAILLAITVLGVLFELGSYLAFMNTTTWSLMRDRGLVSASYTPILEPLFYLTFIIKSAILSAAVLC